MVKRRQRAVSLATIHAVELARADLLGERPLSPEQLLTLSEHINMLADDDPAWIDTLVREADAKWAAPAKRTRSPHSGQKPRRGADAARNG